MAEPMKPFAQDDAALLGSVETVIQPTDKYDLCHFAEDDPARFLELIQYLSPRDAEIMLCFAVLHKRPTDISTLIGKAAHRAQEDIHKAAHKLSGLIAFGPNPSIAEIQLILSQYDISEFGGHSLGSCITEYARCRDFSGATRLIGRRGLRQQMFRTFRILHASTDRAAGLLAGWILWLLDGSDPKKPGWKTYLPTAFRFKLGPTEFRATTVPYGARSRESTSFAPMAVRKGGYGQPADRVKITRQMKFMLRNLRKG